MRKILAILVAVIAFACPGLALALVDINSASETQLETLPGIGPGKAQAIVEYRQANGPFKSIDELGRVKGIGDKTLAELRTQVTVGEPAPASAKPSAPGNAAPAAPERAFPWWIVLAIVAAGGIAVWFMIHRRTAASASAPVGGGGGAQPPATPAAASREPGVRPAPAGAKPAGQASAASQPAPPAPAGPKPAGMGGAAAREPAAKPPPAPAGSKPKSS